MPIYNSGIAIDVGANTVYGLHSTRINANSVLVTWYEIASTIYYVKARVITATSPTSITIGTPFTVYQRENGASPLRPFPLGNDYFCLPVVDSTAYPLAYILKVSPIDLSITVEGSIPNGITNPTNKRPFGFGTLTRHAAGPNASCLIYYGGMAWITTTEGSYTVVQQAIVGAADDLRTGLVNGYEYLGDRADVSGSPNLFTGDGKYWEVDSTTNSIVHLGTINIARDPAKPLEGAIARSVHDGPATLAYLCKQTYVSAPNWSWNSQLYNMQTFESAGLSGPHYASQSYENATEDVNNNAIVDRGDGSFLYAVADTLTIYDPKTGALTNGSHSTSGSSYGASPVGSVLHNLGHSILAVYANNTAMYASTFPVVAYVPPVEPPEPDPLPEAPLFYVGPGWAEEWAVAFIWDGLRWQPFKIFDGTDWHVSTEPL